MISCHDHRESRKLRMLMVRENQIILYRGGFHSANLYLNTYTAVLYK